jgi:hypothetical protein
MNRERQHDWSRYISKLISMTTRTRNIWRRPDDAGASPSSFQTFPAVHKLLRREPTSIDRVITPGQWVKTEKSGKRLGREWLQLRCGKKWGWRTIITHTPYNPYLSFQCMDILYRMAGSESTECYSSACWRITIWLKSENNTGHFTCAVARVSIFIERKHLWSTVAKKKLNIVLCWTHFSRKS